MHSSQLFRRICSEEMDISKRHFVKKREISKISFQQRIRIVIDQKHFYISNGKKKIVAGQMNIFCFKIFRQKISHATNSLHQRENKKNSFFFLIVKLFCHFYDWLFCWKIGKFVFFTRWCVLRDFTFYSRKFFEWLTPRVFLLCSVVIQSWWRYLHSVITDFSDALFRLQFWGVIKKLDIPTI